MIKHKGYIGSFFFDEKTNLFQGKVFNIKYPIIFHGKSIESTKQAFQDSIEDYLEWCKKYGKIPEKPFPIE